MFKAFFANLKVRPFRTLISVIGVALGVILVILFTGFSTRNVGRYVETFGKLEGGDRFHHTTGRDGNDEFKCFSLNQICRPPA